jgi:hypothetical protein
VFRERAEDAFGLVENRRVIGAGEKDLAERQVVADRRLYLGLFRYR